MYNVLKNSIKPNLLQRTAIALSQLDQLTAAREYRLHRRVLYSRGVKDAARRYRTRYFKSPGPVRAGILDRAGILFLKIRNGEESDDERGAGARGRRIGVMRAS